MTDSAATLISRVAPLGVVYAEALDIGQPLPLHPDEEAYVANAADSRRRDFASGRFCARAALSRLGLPDVVIAREADGRPVWPDGIVGSITHTAGYAAALVARKREYLGIGVDAERVGKLTDDLIPLLFGAQEQAWLATLNPERRSLAATSLFSAKEAYFKAWSPLTGNPLSFQALHVEMDDEGFAVAQPGAMLEAWKRPIRGRLAVRADLVVTAVCLQYPFPERGG